MKHYCHYHPISPAKWHCLGCNSYFDNACALDIDEKKRLATCPHCNTSMEYFRDKPVDVPFWQNIPHFLLLPFKPEFALAILFISIGSIAISLNPMLLLPGTLVVTVLACHLGLSVMRSVSESPKARVNVTQLIGSEQLTPNLIASGIIIAAAASVYALTQSLGLIAGLFLALLLLAMLPAWLMSLALEGDIAQSFAPQSIYAPVSSMGQTYLALVAYLGLAILSGMVVADFLDQHAPGYVYAPLVMGTSVYLAIGLSAMFGYVIAEYDSFRSSIDSSLNSDKKDKRNVTVTTDTHLDILLKQGRYEEAVALLETDLKRNSDSEFRRNQYLKLCLAINDLERIERYVHAILRMLISRNQIPFAATVIEKLKQRNEDFRLHDLDVSLDLAKQFQKRKEHKMVLWLAEEAHTRFDDEVELAELYLIAAKVLVSRMKNAPLAAFYLRYVVEHFPEQEVAASAKILQAHVEKYSSAV